MIYIQRTIEKPLKETITKGKSVLLLGPRQTGKTTLLKHLNISDISYSLLDPELRLKFEKSPNFLRTDILSYKKINVSKKPLVIIDEVQKVPALMDVIQLLIDDNEAQFILTGSSVRKLRRHSQFNLLPGRVINFHLDPFSLLELPKPFPAVDMLVTYGSLPGIYLNNDLITKEADLSSYVTNYLEEEIRGEALVRQLESFARFLDLAAIEAGKQINVSKLSQDLGISRHTITEYFTILEDCLVAEKISPISISHTRRRLTKSPKYLFFDMGIRRILTGEGVQLGIRSQAEQFEQLIGLELLRYLRIYEKHAHLNYWRDHAGPEIDYVIDIHKQYIPIEVKWSDSPNSYDLRHILKFMGEYKCKIGFIICRIEKPLFLDQNIIALPWQQLNMVFDEFLKIHEF